MAEHGNGLSLVHTTADVAQTLQCEQAKLLTWHA